MTDIISTTVIYWVQYVFGSYLVAGIFVMLILALFGMRRNWSLDMYIVIFIPIIALLTTSQMGAVFGSTLFTGIVILAGIIIAIGFYRLLR